MLLKKYLINFGGKGFKNIRKTFVSQKKVVGSDLIFIRHAQSQFNKTCDEYRKKNNIPYVWKALCSHEGFDDRVLFNYDFVDTRITKEGRKQCTKTRKDLEEEQIDCILVSPQTRALETCQEIFKNRNIPVFAEPWLSGPLRSCCDLSKPILNKFAQFPQVNFSSMRELGDLWFLDYLSFEQQLNAIQRLSAIKSSIFKERCEELLQMLKEKEIFQDPVQYQKRIEYAKRRISSYNLKYKKIAIVCHYYTIEYLIAQQYEECGTPIFKIDIKNCHPYFTNVEKISSSSKTHQVPSQLQNLSTVALA